VCMWAFVHHLVFQANTNYTTQTTNAAATTSSHDNFIAAPTRQVSGMSALPSPLPVLHKASGLCCLCPTPDPLLVTTQTKTNAHRAFGTRDTPETAVCVNTLWHLQCLSHKVMTNHHPMHQ
jgi:hypothetical protein